MNVRIIGGGKDYNKLVNGLVFMVVKQNLPLNFCDSIGYRTYAKISTPLFHPPCSTTFTQIVDVKYETLFPVVKVDISKASHVAITMDLWKESYKKADVIGLTVHYIENWKLETFVLGINVFLTDNVV